MQPKNDETPVQGDADSPDPGAGAAAATPAHVDETAIKSATRPTETDDPPEVAGSAGAEASIRSSLDPNTRRPGDRFRNLPKVGVPRGEFFSDTLDKTLFIFFTVGGIALLSVLKWIDAPAIYGAGVAILTLVIYATLAARLDIFRLHPDRLGDNCYYMGFLFTLSSLSAALISLESASASLHEQLIEQLIGSFGIALFSTIAGIFLRVFFMQMHREVEDLEEEIRVELQAAAGQLKDQLGYAITEFEIFRVRTQQVMHDRLDHAVDGLSGAVSGSLEKIQVATRQHADAVARLETEIGQASASVEVLARKVASVDLPSDIFSRPMDVAARQVIGITSALIDAANADKARQAAAASVLDGIDTVVRRLAAPALLNDINGAATTLSEALSAATTSTREFVSSVDGQRQAIAALGEDTLTERNRIRKARILIESDLARSREALGMLQGTLVEITDEIARRLGGAENSSQ